MKNRTWIAVFAAALFVSWSDAGTTNTYASEQSQKKKEKKVVTDIKKEPFGKTSDGKPVDLYTLTNANGMKVRIMTYGGIIVSLETPDRKGQLADITLGYETLADYIKDTPYFGALVGRYGNRIAKGKFTLDGTEYQLAVNNDENHLHGGLKGFDKVVWDTEKVAGAGFTGLKMSYLSKDGEENYPGNLQCMVVYKLTDENELKIEYEAVTDKATPLNLTNHAYFNLAGQGNGDILKHEIMLKADRFTPVSKTLIPIGELRSVKGTPFDFTKSTAIGARIAADNEQIRFGNGYDHNFVLNNQDGTLALGGVVYEKTSGRVMEFYTTQPGVQFYTGNFLDGHLIGKGGKPYKFRYGFCLETQHYPDSPNQPNFPSAILKPGEKYEHVTVYKFSAK